MPVFDRVKETTVTTGTGDITLAGAVSNFQAFSDVFSVGDTTFYSIVSDENGWETGTGTYSGVNTLSRTNVLESSNSGNKVSFAAGEKSVFVTYPASKSVTIDQSIALSIALG
jgi:hypothetical protein